MPQPGWSFGKQPTRGSSLDKINPVGPGTYNPNHLAHTDKGIKFGTTGKSGKGAANEDPENKITGKLIEARYRRKQKNKVDMGVPGPKYYIPGDFDFPDPRQPEPPKDRNWVAPG